MKVAISQPTYLPWAGYFDLIDQVDAFVFLDHVQFEKRSWQQRNRIKGPNGLILLTVPVMVKGRFAQTIVEAAISEPAGWQKHQRALEINYQHAPFFQKYRPGFCDALQAGWNSGSLCTLNLTLIRWCMRELGIDKPVMRSSEMSCAGKRGELLANLCAELGADLYLSTIGSAIYLLEEERPFQEKGITVQFQNYVHPEYEQRFPPFVAYASAIDLLFNLGDLAMDVLRSGRRKLLSGAEVRSGREQQMGAPL